jgi:hypothetical protein
MVRKQLPVIAVVILAVSVFVVYHYYFDEETKVKRTFQTFAERISKTEEQSKLIEAASINKALHLFSKQIHLEIPSHSISRTYQRRDLSGPLFARRSVYQKIDLSFFDFIIRFPQEGIARVDVTMRLKARRDDDHRVDETRVMICDLVRNTEGDWRLERAEVVEVLEK